MITNSNRGSAKIYAFPARVRPAVVAHAENARPVADLAAQRLPKTTFGSGWYHDDAIAEAAQKPRI